VLLKHGLKILYAAGILILCTACQLSKNNVIRNKVVNVDEDVALPQQIFSSFLNNSNILISTAESFQLYNIPDKRARRLFSDIETNDEAKPRSRRRPVFDRESRKAYIPINLSEGFIGVIDTVTLDESLLQFNTEQLLSAGIAFLRNELEFIKNLERPLENYNINERRLSKANYYFELLGAENDTLYLCFYTYTEENKELNYFFNPCNIFVLAYDTQTASITDKATFYQIPRKAHYAPRVIYMNDKNTMVVQDKLIKPRHKLIIGLSSTGYEKEAPHIALSYDGRYIAHEAPEGITFLEADSGNIIDIMAPDSTINTSVFSDLVFSRSRAAIYNDFNLYIYDFEEKAVMHIFKNIETSYAEQGGRSIPSLTSIDISPDSTLFLFGKNYKGTSTLFDMNDYNEKGLISPLS
jgi:WD40 repeat protein